MYSCLMFDPIYSLGKISGCFFFFIWETKKVVAGRIRQVVILYSNNCMGICLGGLSVGHLTEVVV